MTDPAVSLKDIVKRFGDFTAVDHVSLEIPTGEIFGFLGPNGAGKSTTIRMMCGLLTPTSGQGRVHGLDIITQSEEIKANLGYMSQRFSLYDDLRVEENMAFFGGIYGLDPRLCKKRSNDVLDLIGLSDRRQTLTRELPGGFKQRLALGCALLHNPPIVFLDEPTSGVDPGTRRNFWDLIYQLSDGGVTIFVTTHYMEEAEYCGRIGLIDQGRLIAVGSPTELKSRHLKGKIYEVETSDLLKGVESLQGAEQVLDTAVFGRTLHVRLDENTDAEEYLAPLLASAGLDTGKIRKIEPTLEDVFVSLVGHDLSDIADVP
jgi:ABC-2 type transport system ATP-binding protein